MRILIAILIIAFSLTGLSHSKEEKASPIKITFLPAVTRSINSDLLNMFYKISDEVFKDLSKPEIMPLAFLVAESTLKSSPFQEEISQTFWDKYCYERETYEALQKKVKMVGSAQRLNIIYPYEKNDRTFYDRVTSWKSSYELFPSLEFNLIKHDAVRMIKLNHKKQVHLIGSQIDYPKHFKPIRHGSSEFLTPIEASLPLEELAHDKDLLIKSLNQCLPELAASNWLRSEQAQQWALFMGLELVLRDIKQKQKEHPNLDFYMLYESVFLPARLFSDEELTIEYPLRDSNKKYHFDQTIEMNIGIEDRYVGKMENIRNILNESFAHRAI